MPRKYHHMPPALRERLPVALARRLDGMERRLLPRQLDDVIAQMCACGPWGFREIAAVLNRSAVYLQNTSLKRLLAAGRLRFLHPEEPTHPRQAYVAATPSTKAAQRAVPRQSKSPQKPLSPKPPTPVPLDESGPLSIGVND